MNSCVGVPILKHDIRTLDKKAFVAMLKAKINLRGTYVLFDVSFIQKKKNDTVIETLNEALLVCFRTCSSLKDTSKVFNSWWCSELNIKRKELRKCERRWRKSKTEENCIHLKKVKKEYKEF